MLQSLVYLPHLDKKKISAAELTHRDFIEWLENHRHEEIKNLILRTADMRNDVDIFLKEDHDKMIIKLEEISSVLSSIVGRLDGFSGIAKHFSSELVISDQGYYLLKTLVDSDEEYLMHMRFIGGFQINVGNQQLDIAEPRFLQDDLDNLVRYGLLTPPPTSNGSLRYRVTRKAVAFLRATR